MAVVNASHIVKERGGEVTGVEDRDKLAIIFHLHLSILLL